MTKINAQALAAAVTAAVLAALREDNIADTPAPKKAGKAAETPATKAPAVEADPADPADLAAAIRALRAEYRAEYGAAWHEDPAVKAKFAARKAALRKRAATDSSAAPAAKPSLALGEAEVLALKAKFRAEHGPRWFEIPAVKAEYNAIRWAKPTAPQDSAPAAKAAEGDLDNLGLRALQALRKEMGLKGRLGESAEAVREQIRGARAAAEPKAKAKAKATGKAKGRAAL